MPGGGRLVKIVHIAGCVMLSNMKWYQLPFGVGVLTILNDQNGIFYLKMSFFTKNLPIFGHVFLVTPVEPYSEFVKIIHFAKKEPFFIQLTHKFQKMYILSSRITGC